MKTEHLTVLSEEEQQNLGGGGWLGCLASGALFVVGVADLNPVIILSALIAADKTC